MNARLRRARNDPGLYDDLVEEWWKTDGAFALLHSIAAARAALVPPAGRTGAVLVDAGCGAGLLAPHVEGLGYRHVGVDLTTSALVRAAAHGVTPTRGDVTRVPFADGVADVVCAGEILEHVTPVSSVVGELCRILRPGGSLVIDTIAATRLARLLAVDVAERIPGGAPPGIHDPALFVDRRDLVATARRHGVDLTLRGLRPEIPGTFRWLVRGRRGPLPAMVPTRPTSVLFQAYGTKGPTR